MLVSMRIQLKYSPRVAVCSVSVNPLNRLGGWEGGGGLERLINGNVREASTALVFTR